MILSRWREGGWMDLWRQTRNSTTWFILRYFSIPLSLGSMKSWASTVDSVREPVCRVEKIEVLKDAIPTVNTVKFLSIVCLSPSCCSSSAPSPPPPALHHGYTPCQAVASRLLSWASSSIWASILMHFSSLLDLWHYQIVLWVPCRPPVQSGIHLLKPTSDGTIFGSGVPTQSSHWKLGSLSSSCSFHPHTCLSLPCDDIS